MNKMYSKNIPEVKNATARRNSGFTLIELLVVVLIIGILSAVALPEYTKAVEKSRSSEAVSLLRSLLVAEQAYKMANLGFTPDFSQLDLEMPNLDPDNPTVFQTDNWEITTSINPASPTTMTIFAARAKDGVKITLGKYVYGIYLKVDSDGTVTWKCQQSIGNGAVPEICKSITGNAEGNMN